VAIAARTIVALDEWLGRAARKRPDQPALLAGGRALSYAQLDREASVSARRLAALGVEAGDRVATTLPSGPDFCALLHALPRLGAVLVSLDPRAPARSGARVTVTKPLTGEEADVPLRATVDPDAVHCVMHTSGTTGRPKAVELTYGNHRASAEASADAFALRSGDRWLCPLPLFHVGGLAVLLRSVIAATTAVLHDGFEADRVRDALERGDITLASMVPTMLQRLRETGLSRVPALRGIALGGGPVPAGLLDWAEAAGVPAVPVYGMTETASQVVAGSPGRPLRGVELRIDGGEILVRGPMVARGALAPDGWLHTGDLGRLDEHGRLHVEGRLKELIVTGGENVAPLEVEQALLTHPAVADAGVAGLPDPEWGEAVTAFVVLQDAVSADELRDWCRERLAPAAVPKALHTVERLPRNAAGKLLRQRLGASEGA
jgi:O-succinylbenzoic acid--CoA ligase